VVLLLASCGREKTWCTEERLHHELLFYADTTTKRLKGKKRREKLQGKGHSRYSSAIAWIFKGTDEVGVQGKSAFKLRRPSSRLLSVRAGQSSSPPQPSKTALFLVITTTMPTELPYAADAEMSLDYDELEVRSFSPVARDTPTADLPAAHRFCGYNTRRNSRKTTSLRRPSLITPGG
jgi:hypothetical protein